MTNDAQIRRVDVDTFSIPIGSRVIIEPAGLGGKIKTYFIGMERKSYFIVSLAPVIGEDKLAYNYLYKGNKTKIFFTQEGVINGFMAKVILYTTSPFRHIYFTYPTDAEICNLRKATRTDCHLPARIPIGGKERTCMIGNISTSGCGITLRNISSDILELIPKDKPVPIRFYLVKSTEELTAMCEVKNLRREKDGATLGLKFCNLDEHVSKRITEFITWVLNYRL